MPTPQPYTEKSLVEGCVNNDRRAQEALYKQHFGTMMRMAMRYTQDKDTAMQIVNNGFLRVFKKLHTFSFSGSLEGWIRRLVFHSISDYYRKHSKSMHFLDLEDRDAPTQDGIMERLYMEDVLKLVDYLPDASRQVFVLYAIEGYTHAEIGGQLNISAGTSKWHLSNARKKLKQLVRTYYNHAG